MEPYNKIIEIQTDGQRFIDSEEVELMINNAVDDAIKEYDDRLIDIIKSSGNITVPRPNVR